MAHLITPPRRNARVAVVDDAGYPLSWHVTTEAAARRIARDRRALARRPGSDRSYLPRTIITIPPWGAYVQRLYADSTGWRLA